MPSPTRTGGYVYVPDLPVCTTYADSWEELASNAHEAVTSWLTIEDERGHQLPPPTIGGESTWQPGDFLVSSISKSTDATPLTTQDVAARLGVTPRRVQALARSRKVGRRLGRALVFTDADLAALSDRHPGRPPARMR